MFAIWPFSAIQMEKNVPPFDLSAHLMPHFKPPSKHRLKAPFSVGPHPFSPFKSVYQANFPKITPTRLFLFPAFLTAQHVRGIIIVKGMLEGRKGSLETEEFNSRHLCYMLAPFRLFQY
jgi:hypothetical protein